MSSATDFSVVKQLLKDSSKIKNHDVNDRFKIVQSNRNTYLPLSFSVYSFSFGLQVLNEEKK